MNTFPKLSRVHFYSISISIIIFLSCVTESVLAGPQLSYTLHFNDLNSVTQARALVDLAKKSGATSLNIVPPAHIWEDTNSRAILDTVFDESQKQKMNIVITRIDANLSDGTNFLYKEILNQSGALPGESLSVKRSYLATIGNEKYILWMKEETLFYSKMYGTQPNLIGFNIGFYSDPFASKMGSFLVLDPKTKKYEIAQYTPMTQRLWQNWLEQKLSSIDRVNQEYQSNFSAFTEIPLPLNENDKRFGSSNRAYSDFISCINDWVVENYTNLQSLWHQNTKTPFIFQISGNTADHLAKGRAAYAGLDIPKWLSIADAVGISLYTDSSQDNPGLDSLQGTLNLCAFATEIGKPLFILESGSQIPDTKYYSREGLVKMFLAYQPDLVNYEFFVERKVTKIHDPRYMVSSKGKMIEPAYTQFKKLFLDMNQTSATRIAPYLYIVTSPRVTRDDLIAGRFYAMAHSASSFVPIRWVNFADMAFIPSKALVLLAPSWKAHLTDFYQQEFMKLAKGRKWQVLLDEQSYPVLKQNLGKDLHGGTIDLAGFLKEDKSVNAGLGFGKAIVDYYESTFKDKPNTVSPDIGLSLLNTNDSIWINLDQPPEGKLSLDLNKWDLSKIKFLTLTVNSLDTKPVTISLTPDSDSKTNSKSIRIETLNPKNHKMALVRTKVTKQNIEFLADNLKEYHILLAQDKKK